MLSMRSKRKSFGLSPCRGEPGFPLAIPLARRGKRSCIFAPSSFSCRGPCTRSIRPNGWPSTPSRSSSHRRQTMWNPLNGCSTRPSGSIRQKPSPPSWITTGHGGESRSSSKRSRPAVHTRSDSSRRTNLFNAHSRCLSLLPGTCSRSAPLPTTTALLQPPKSSTTFSSRYFVRCRPHRRFPCLSRPCAT